MCASLSAKKTNVPGLYYKFNKDNNANIIKTDIINCTLNIIHLFIHVPYMKIKAAEEMS